MSDDYHMDMKVLEWRELIRQGKGDQITREDMKLAVAALRGDRMHAQTAKESAPARGSKTKAAAENAQGLLADFLAQTGSKSLKTPDPE